MILQHFFCTCAMILFATFAGCDASQQSAPQSTVTPEETYRSFMVANLSGDESAIRPLILDHDDAHILWQGAYPAEVATLLSEQYRAMEITRVESSADGNRVEVRSSAVPIVIAVVQVDGNWKVDAGPIIELRKSAEKFKSQ